MTKMEKLIASHHSVADWDFQPDSWAGLDDYTFISEPTSLACPIKKSTYYQYVWVFLKEALGGNVAHGKICTWLWISHATTSTPRFFFRAQSLPPTTAGAQEPDDCYLVLVNQNVCTLYRRINKSNTTVGSHPWDPPLTEMTWNKIALTWETVTMPGGDWLAFLVEQEVDEAWKQYPLIYDTQNLWATSGVNRVGFRIAGTRSTPGKASRVDDTEVWKRKEAP